MRITLTVNGENLTCEVEPDEKLLDTLRFLGFTGVKKGCGEGTCGTCVVLLDGRPVNSCVVFTPAAEGREVTTIEGLGDVDSPHVLQEQFVKAGAVQCGFCTPGMILAAKALLQKDPRPDDAAIKSALDGNLCRCTGYVKIIDAVKNAADLLSPAGAGSEGGEQ